MRRAQTAVVLAFLLALTACGGESTTVTTTATVAARSEATLPPTPRPTSTPYPIPTQPPPSGRVLSRLLVSCELANFGLEVRVRYGASVEEAASDIAAITRLRIFVNGALYEDSGVIANQIFAREATFGGRANQRYRVQLDIDTWGTPQAANLAQIIRCPGAPDNPQA